MRTRLWPAVIVTVGAFAVDRVTRALAFRSPAQDVLPGVLRSEPHFNSGIAFGIPLPNALLLPLLGMLVLGITAVATFAYRRRWLAGWWASLLILAGAWSNLLDRFSYEAVRDFLRVPLWPTTGNLGDWMITVGAVLLLVTSTRRRRSSSG